MACLPGMPCYGGGRVVFPRGCGVDPCHAHNTNTDLVFYSGTNLPCVGANTCDDLTLVLQKIDEAICQLQSTTSSTTTITTTAAPCTGPGVPILLFAYPGTNEVTACANYNASARTIYYVSAACSIASNLGDADCSIYLDCALTIPAPNNYVYIDSNGWAYQLSVSPADGLVVTWSQC